MSTSPFRIKICGITSVDDARAAIDAGADAIGLNFYPNSQRFIGRDLEAAGISLETRMKGNRAVNVVGVFVNSAGDVIRKHIDRDGLDVIQLHGDESPECIASFRRIPVIRARRMDDRGVASIAEDLAACEAAGRLPDAVLVDAMTPGRYGGTGETVSWAGLADHPKWLGDVPLILAGGLTPENVAEAIRIVRPAGVDVASGVESSPGVKDYAKMRAFVQAAKTALETL